MEPDYCETPWCSRDAVARYDGAMMCENCLRQDITEAGEEQRHLATLAANLCGQYIIAAEIGKWAHTNDHDLRVQAMTMAREIVRLSREEPKDD